MANFFTPPPPDTKLSDSAARTLVKLSQRSKDDLIFLKLIYTRIMTTLDHEVSFFLPLPTSQYNPTPKTQVAILQDTGALLTLRGDFPSLVLRGIEGRTNKLKRENMSEKQWKKVEILSTWLAAQHPDHVTNVFRLWQLVMRIKEEETQEMKESTVKDLGLLFQHRHAEAVVVMDKVTTPMELVLKIPGEGNGITQDEDEDDWKMGT